jgi:hypothetical protein
MLFCWAMSPKSEAVVLSSIHRAGSLDKETQKPQIVKLYNQTKGVNSLDKVWKLFCESANSEVAKGHILRLFFRTAINSHVLYNFYPKRKEIHLLDFMQQLPLELILPEVWIHVFWKEFGCWFGVMGPDAIEVFTEKPAPGPSTTEGQKVFCESLIVESVFLQISFTYATNRIGPNSLPCGTPGVTLTSSDNYIPVHNQTFMRCKFSFRLQHIQWLYMNINRIYTDFFHCQILSTIHYLLEAASMGEAVSYRNIVYCVE